MSREGCFFVYSRYILSLFIFQFVYLCLYFHLFIVVKDKFDIRKDVYTYHKTNPALPVLFDYMEKMVLLCRDSVLHVAGSRQRKWSRLGKTITFTCNTKIDFIKKQAHQDLSKQSSPRKVGLFSHVIRPLEGQSQIFIPVKAS